MFFCEKDDKGYFAPQEGFLTSCDARVYKDRNGEYCCENNQPTVAIISNPNPSKN